MIHLTNSWFDVIKLHQIKTLKVKQKCTECSMENKTISQQIAHQNNMSWQTMTYDFRLEWFEVVRKQRWLH